MGSSDWAIISSAVFSRMPASGLARLRTWTLNSWEEIVTDGFFWKRWEVWDPLAQARRGDTMQRTTIWVFFMLNLQWQRSEEQHPELYWSQDSR